MNAEDIKEQILSQLRQVGDRIQDTPAYQNLKERFDSLSTSAQKGLIAAVVAVFFLIILSFPWSMYSESAAQVDGFDGRRNVMRELLKVSREVADVPMIPVPPPMETLKADAEARLKESNLVDEQMKGVTIETPASSLIPSDRAMGGLQISLAKLNVSQLTNIGARMNALHPSLKMVGVEVTANRQEPKYFDVIYRLVALAVPDLSAPPPVMEDEPKKKAPTRKGRSGDEE